MHPISLIQWTSGVYWGQCIGNNVANCDNGIMWLIGTGPNPVPPPTTIFFGSPVHWVIQGNYIYGCAPITGIGMQTVCCTPYVATTPSFCSVKDNVVELAPYYHYGACNITLDGNTVYTKAGSPQVGFDFMLTNTSPHYGSSQVNLALQYQIRATNNSFYDSLNRTSFTTSNFQIAGGRGMTNVVASGNTFQFDAGTLAARPVQRTFFTQQSGLTGVPYGYEFLAGDLIIDAAGPASWIVTTAGSRNPTVDTYTVVSASGGIIASSDLAWTGTPYHTFGQAITLSDGTNIVNGYVGEIYISGTNQQMNIVNANYNPVNLGALGSGTITATNPLTAISV